eukprot:GHUV01024878.1.p1 GENE.GHUV01024878.1~~GHUV01024878.1.p1  ORF type:complete len:139 (-),score=1.64 GHUV01024878.1:506-922(-)
MGMPSPSPASATGLRPSAPRACPSTRCGLSATRHYGVYFARPRRMRAMAHGKHQTLTCRTRRPAAAAVFWAVNTAFWAVNTALGAPLGKAIRWDRGAGLFLVTGLVCLLPCTACVLYSLRLIWQETAPPIIYIMIPPD